jgi:hypothetical protein
MTKEPLFHPVLQWIVNAKFMPQGTSAELSQFLALQMQMLRLSPALGLGGGGGRGCRDEWIPENPQPKGQPSGFMKDPDSSKLGPEQLKMLPKGTHTHTHTHTHTSALSSLPTPKEKPEAYRLT